MSNPQNTFPQTPNAELSDNRTWRDYFRQVAQYGISCLVTALSATAGTHGAPPAQVAGYIVITIQNTNYKVPYYNV